MGGERIVPPPDSAVHRGSFFRMKGPFPRSPLRKMDDRPDRFSKRTETPIDQACRPVFMRSRISVSNFSSFDGPGAGAATAVS